MPPRRSARNSLPTPASSTRSGRTISVSSTPGAIEPKPAQLVNGLLTPQSMSDDFVSDVLDNEEQDIKPEPRNTKRKRVASSPGEPDSVFAGSTAPTGHTAKYELSVEIPSIRKKSKLATEKTTSADNLTLGSPPDRKPERSSSGVLGSDPLDGVTDEEVKPAPVPPRASRAKFTSHKASKEGQPFNIGTFSSVKKETAADLALDAKDIAELSTPDSTSTTSRRKPARASAQKAKVKYIESSDDELGIIPKTETETEVDVDGDSFAFDSEEEEQQLQKAINASKKTRRGRASTSSAGTSSAASSTGRGRGKNAVKKGDLLRTAAAKAAERRLAMAAKADFASSGSESEYEPDTKSTTQALADDSESALSDLTDDDFDDSDADLPSPRRRGGVAKGKGKGKGKVKSERFAGVGNRLDGAPVPIIKKDDYAHVGYVDRFDGEESDDYDRRCYANYHSDIYRVENEDFKRQERKLKQKVGRKLTNGEKNHIRLVKYHPELQDVWGDIAEKIVPIKPVPMEAHPSLKLTLLPFQKESLHWMKKQEEGPWKGGMLADEMGMGKTIQTIALLLSEPRRKPSLVVAPVVALMQWKHEIETHAEGFTVCLWHGQGRMKAEQLKKYDVVLSSYGTLEAAFRRQQRGFKKGNVFIKESSPVHSFQWHRVVLDEAHNIKERSTNAAKAAFSLDSQYKWCLSGTPLQNRVGELYSLVRFLGADPFSHYFCKRCDCKSLHWQFKNNRECDQCGHTPMQHVCFWNSEILNPIARYGIEAGNPGHTSFKKLKILLDRMMLRRTKLERADDLGLPPRTIVVRRDYFSPEEKELYMSLFTNARRQFSTYVGAGTVLNNYSNIFSLITRMRQMACHPDLVLRGKTAKILPEAEEGTVCRLCNDQAEDAIMSGCKHIFDRECIRQYLEVQQMRGHKPECPVCHIEISIDLEAEAIDLTEGNNKKARQGILSRLDLSKWRSSTKLEALVEELEKLRKNDCTTKSLVFSQFVSFLDLIAFRLQRAGFNICRLEGGMTPQQRDATIQHFMNNPGVTVFLISLKAGGVALNLTEASMVFMMDSWWNPSVEYQAMDRIHRLGQKRPVKVVKLVVEDSIEDQIVQLQHKKLAMTEAALSTDPDAALGKLTVEDLGFLFKM